MLTDEQTKKYFETQSGQAEPLSPLAFLSSERGEDLLYKTQKKKERLTPPEVEKPKEEVKETEKEKTGGGMTFDDALSLYGEDFTGVHKLDDGTYEADTTAQERIGIKTDPIELQIAESKRDVATAKTDIETAQNRLRNLDISKDPSFVALSTGISNTWNDRIAEMEKANLSRVASMTQLGIRYGSKYTGGSFGSIITEEERQGIQRVSSLEAKKQQALAGAEIAFRSQKWEEYSEFIDMAEDAYNREVEELNNLNELAIKQSELLTDKIKEEREASEFEMDRVENVLENITNSVLNALTGDEDTDMALLQEYADYYDIDPDYLINSLTKAQTAQTKAQESLKAVQALTEQRLAGAEKARRITPTTGETKEVKEKDDLKTFREMIKNRPDASRAELKASGFEETDLSVSQINAELDSAGIIEEKVKFTSDQIKNIAVAVVKSLTKIFKGGEIERAKELIQNGVLEINNKITELSAKQIQQILSEIDIQYPEGQRSILQRVLPKGK